MRVFHFLNEQFGLKDLRERRIKVARIMELNDPFEFLGVDLSDKYFRKGIKETKAELSKTNGLLCFSKNWTNPLLWGHYADKHKGICLEFEIPDKHLGKVDYVKNRLPKPTAIDELDEAFMGKLLLTKFEHWDYEEEYRVFITLDEQVNGIYYANFSKNLELKRVIVGDQSQLTRAQIAEALSDLSDKVEVFKARAGFTTFEVVENKNDALWT